MHSIVFDRAFHKSCTSQQSWSWRSFRVSVGDLALALGGRVFKTGGQLLVPAGGAALEAGVHPVNGAVRF